MPDVKFGVNLWPLPLEQAERVEELGFDSLWTSEHMLFYVPMFDAVTVLAAFAARTKRLLLGSAVLLLPLRHPTVLAKEVASLDIISNGRIILGAGVGGEFAREFVACGVPLSERGPRTDESIQVMRRLWSESHVNHDGRFFRLEDATMEPKPVQRPGRHARGGAPAGEPGANPALQPAVRPHSRPLLRAGHARSVRPAPGRVR